MRISSLAHEPAFAAEIANIYYNEWGWHYAEEWGLPDAPSIETDLRANYMSDTFVLVNSQDTLVGTVALLAEDLRCCSQLTPWLTCLYVKPEHRNRGYGRMLISYALTRHATSLPISTRANSIARKVYLWAYEKTTHDWYVMNGWVPDRTLVYRGNPAYVLSFATM